MYIILRIRAWYLICALLSCDAQQLNAFPRSFSFELERLDSSTAALRWHLGSAQECLRICGAFKLEPRRCSDMRSRSILLVNLKMRLIVFAQRRRGGEQESKGIGAAPELDEGGRPVRARRC
jgi:hypothetical protein